MTAMTSSFKGNSLKAGYKHHISINDQHSGMDDDVGMDDGQSEVSLRNKQKKAAQSIIDHKGGCPVENFELRCLCTAALLRVIYASIQFAPTPELRKSAVDNLDERQSNSAEG